MMATPRLCERCKNLQLRDLIEELEKFFGTYSSSNLTTLYTLSHDEFYECASLCDICAATASHFGKDTDVMGERNGEPIVSVSARKDNNKYRLIFTDKSNWNDVSWMICDNDGEQQFLY
jgi:hypothetical protein